MENDDQRKKRNREYARRRRAESPEVRQKEREAALRYYKKIDGAKVQREKRKADPNYREKQREYMRRYRAEKSAMYRKSRRSTDLKSRYGMTLEEYETQLQDQQHKCFICGTADPGKKEWCVDHCHTQNHVRKILCRSCNLALGAARDNPAILRRMADYIESHRRQE